MRTASSILVAATLLVAGTADAGAAGRRAPFRVMTYNVNFGMSGNAATLNAIRNEGAEVVLLQETNPRWERALRRTLSKVYPHMEFRHHRRAGGLAILSKYPFSTADYLPSPLGWFPAWRAVVDTPFGALQVLNLHLIPSRPDGDSWIKGYFKSQRKRMAETRAYLKLLRKNLPTIVAGDFNEDVTGSSVAAWLAAGLRSVMGADVIPTWRWKTRRGDVRWQLDHMLVSSNLAVDAARVLSRGDSDHLPLIATLRFVP